MINPIAWAVSRYHDWKFYREFKAAPVKRLGDIFVKEVQGNLYAVTLEIVPAKGRVCECGACDGKKLKRPITGRLGFYD